MCVCVRCFITIIGLSISTIQEIWWPVRNAATILSSITIGRMIIYVIVWWWWLALSHNHFLNILRIAAFERGCVVFEPESHRHRNIHIYKHTHMLIYRYSQLMMIRGAERWREESGEREREIIYLLWRGSRPFHTPSISFCTPLSPMLSTPLLAICLGLYSSSSSS